jgi:tRNA(fMet)-specific endonuclease VapC
MSGTFLLDTNAIIARIAGDAAVQALLIQADEVFIPTIALGEMYYGAEHSGRIRDNLAQVERFAAGRTVLVCDAQTARWYGRIRYRLRVKGRPIPDNDLWIAAIALQHSLTIVTRDEHFNEVDGLAVERW